MTIALLILIALLAYANGSNDNGKGVATLVGFGAASARQALLYATLTTVCGAILSFWFSGGLIKSFSTKLFADGSGLTQAFFVAVLIGAFGWVILATFTGLPVSTTHAIMGALIGAGLVAFGQSTIQWSLLISTFVIPLVISPFASLLIVYTFAWPVGWAAKRYAERCICLAQRVQIAAITPGGAVIVGGAAPALVVDYESQCATSHATPVATTSAVASAVHWFAAGMIGFARGWNDTPKIAALALFALPASMAPGFAIVAVAMAIGGLVAGRRVLETLAKKLTPLPLPESLTASLTTATLVSLASWNGLPVSTTHVSTGAIIGAGLKNDAAGVRWKKVAEIVLSWIVTLPAAALIAAVARWLIG